MEHLPTQQTLLSTEPVSVSDELDVAHDGIAAQEFSEYLADTDTDEENSGLAPSRRYVWYCKLRTCSKYYTAWSCKTNFLLYLYETPVHRDDPTTSTREGRRQLSRSWREETAYDLSEPKKEPPQEHNNHVGDKGQ
ncbi:MAG: hypothetical protein Q9217_006637 [Psora testacea]